MRKNIPNSMEEEEDQTLKLSLGQP